MCHAIYQLLPLAHACYVGKDANCGWPHPDKAVTKSVLSKGGIQPEPDIQPFHFPMLDEAYAFSRAEQFRAAAWSLW